MSIYFKIMKEFIENPRGDKYISQKSNNDYLAKAK